MLGSQRRYLHSPLRVRIEQVAKNQSKRNQESEVAWKNLTPTLQNTQGLWWIGMKSGMQLGTIRQPRIVKASREPR